MDIRAAAAARNNAEWCDAVSRAHGAPGRFEPGFWINPGDAPPYYPNLVTLDPAATGLQRIAIEELLDRRTGGVGIKDSFHALDLGDFGMLPVFTAQWLWLDGEAAPEEAPSGAVETIGNPAALAEWEASWRQGEAGGTVFPETLLADPRLAFLALRRDGDIIAGAAINRSEGVIGLSNVFHNDHDDIALAALIAASRRLAPGAPIVGYEHGASLDRFLSAGFESVGPLRVWIRAEE